MYKFLNEKETRLSAFKDSDEMLAAKLIQLAYINETRAKFKVQPVRLDILACRVANKMATEAAIKKYAGHWNLAGEKPYHRWASAGGFDHVAENAAAISTNGRLDESPRGAVRMMHEMYDEFMAEKPPEDGHRRTCIDKYHNYVGLGYFTTRYEFRYYEEYLDRYLIFSHVDSEVKPEEECRIVFKPRTGTTVDLLRAAESQESGNPDRAGSANAGSDALSDAGFDALSDAGFDALSDTGSDVLSDAGSDALNVYALLVYWEPFPEPMTPYRINRMGSYDDYSPDKGISIWPWELDQYLIGDKYEIPLIFPEEGLYYIHIYLDDQEFTGTSASTEGKLQASGIVIRVED